MDEPTEELRAGMRTNLQSALERDHPENDVEPLARELEQAGYARAVGAKAVPLSAGSPARRDYVTLMGFLTRRLAAQLGPFPDDQVAAQLVGGRLTVADVVKEADQTPEALGPRETILRMFVRTLVAANKAFAADRPRTLATAQAIEVACYNEAVRLCKDSEEPPRRNWDSPAFVDVYSTRCGTVNALLDPASASTVEYGADVAGRLLLADDMLDNHGNVLAYRLTPAALGRMSEKELCPAATEAERAEIARRSGLQVKPVESNLFRCPHCGERKSTYVGVQRRALDEAQDNMCVCLVCHRHFMGR